MGGWKLLCSKGSIIPTRHVLVCVCASVGKKSAAGLNTS